MDLRQCNRAEKPRSTESAGRTMKHRNMGHLLEIKNQNIIPRFNKLVFIMMILNPQEK